MFKKLDKEIRSMDQRDSSDDDQQVGISVLAHCMRVIMYVIWLKIWMHLILASITGVP
jgi:hypothetical protein